MYTFCLFEEQHLLVAACIIVMPGVIVTIIKTYSHLSHEPLRCLICCPSVNIWQSFAGIPSVMWSESTEHVDAEGFAIPFTHTHLLTIPLLDCFYIHVCYDMTTSEWMRHDKIRKVGYLTSAWLDAEWVTLFLLCACSWMAMVWQKCLNPAFQDRLDWVAPTHQFSAFNQITHWFNQITTWQKQMYLTKVVTHAELTVILSATCFILRLKRFKVGRVAVEFSSLGATAPVPYFWTSYVESRTDFCSASYIPAWLPNRKQWNMGKSEQNNWLSHGVLSFFPPFF